MQRFLTSLVLLLSALFIPFSYSTNQETLTQTQTLTFVTTQTQTSLNVVVSSYTQTQTVPGFGPPPQVIISNLKWIPPTLSFYLQNAGGSGTVTLVIFVDGYSGTQTYHVDAFSATTFTLNFAGYTGTTPPTIRVVQQVPDSGSVPEPVVNYVTQTSYGFVTNVNTVFITQVTTLSFTATSTSASALTTATAPQSPSIPVSAPWLILPLAGIVIVALLLLGRTRRTERGANGRRTCPNCGQPAGNDKFCQNCGQRIDELA